MIGSGSVCGARGRGEARNERRDAGKKTAAPSAHRKRQRRKGRWSSDRNRDLFPRAGRASAERTPLPPSSALSLRPFRARNSRRGLIPAHVRASSRPRKRPCLCERPRKRREGERVRARKEKAEAGAPRLRAGLGSTRKRKGGTVGRGAALVTWWRGLAFWRCRAAAPGGAAAARAVRSGSKRATSRG